MKTKYILLSIAFIYTIRLKAQSSDDILNLLIQKGAITQNDADSLRADNAIKQQDQLKDKTFKIDAELRTRSEFRNGYRQLRNDTTVPAFFTNQRTRLLFTYEIRNKFIFHTSIQDVRVWGQYDARSNNATIQAFEAYAEIFFNPNLSVKIGRQKIALDNQRLFAENDWRANAGSHDAVRLAYNNDKLFTELYLAFNQWASNNQAGAEPIFGTNYSPGFTNYKSLGVHYLKYKFHKYFTLTTINAADGYQDSKYPEKIHQRYTDGGRVEFEKGKLYVTASAYYQSGKNSTGKNLNAFYIQPEIKYTVPENFTLRLGAEVFSGDNGKVKNASDHNFVALYGVAHRFNGSMDYFITFPADFNNAGLVNPYLFAVKNIGKKVELRADFHLFYTQNHFVQNNETISRYLGYENDWLLTYKPNSYTKIDLGVSYLIPTKSMEIIKQGGSSAYTPTWAYISISFKPQLFKTSFK